MRVVVVGAGIVGLAVARELALRHPDQELIVVEKESEVGRHQTGHNSGVIHSGIYYAPGSAKAQLCRRGRDLLKDFCDEQDVQYRQLGKLIVAVDDVEAGRLTDLHARAVANGLVDVEVLGPAGMREIEPHVRGVAALHSPSTAVTDFGAVARALERDICARGAEIRCSSPVTSVRQTATAIELDTPAGVVAADHAVVCAGLHASRMARLFGDDDDPRIVPFRGEYHRVELPSADLVRGLVYPVPDPRYPFLGVHLTRHLDGSVDVGPNAVLACALEGYRRRDISMRDLSEIIRWSGFRTMARRHWRTGVQEVLGSVSRRHVVSRARRYVPDLAAADFRPAPAGVRAQAVGRDGSLIDDFRITTSGRVTSVRNAPSPAATSSLAIAQHIAAMVPVAARR